MRRLLNIGLASIGLFLSMTGAAQANLITNGSFEDGAYSGGPFVTLYSNTASATSITGWTVLAPNMNGTGVSSIDWIGSYWTASAGEKSLDLAGNYMHGLIMTTFETDPGRKYRVQFDMAGNPDKPYEKSLMTAAISGEAGAATSFSFSQTGNTRDSMGWETKYFDFVAGDSDNDKDNVNFTQLFFGDFTNPDNPIEAWGAAIDNVSVEVAPVPEPSTFVLFGVSLAALGFIRRNRSKSQ